MVLIWRALDKLDNEQAADAFRLIVLTGCRRAEAVMAKSSEYSNGHWKLPRERVKNNVECILPLPSIARAIFEKSADLEGVFHQSPRKDTFQKPLLQLREEVNKLAGRELEHWDLHGIRHGVRTVLRGKRLCTKEIAERILNHASGGIDERYDHELYLDEKQEALDRWQALLLDKVESQFAKSTVIDKAAGFDVLLAA